MVEPIAERAAAPPRQPPVRRKRRRWIGWVVASVILLGLLVVAFLVADNYARSYAQEYVRERIIEVLDLEPDAAVTVDLGAGSVLFQALSGSIDSVTVGLDELTFGDVTGEATLEARGVPLDEAQPVEKLDATVTITEENVRELAAFLSGTELNSIELEDGIIAIGTEFSIFGLVVIPVGMDLLPSVVDGGIRFEPQSVTLGDEAISVAELRDNPQLSGLASQFLASRDYCVAEFLPEAFVIDDVDVVGSNLVVSINGDGVALSGQGLSTMGSCP
jgi:hypothetical protein